MVQETINKINIQWLQVGTNDEKNLENCINLNGKTNIRELLCWFIRQSLFYVTRVI